MRSPLSHDKVTRILIVDDHPATREGLAARIALAPGLEVCAEAADEAEALRRFEEQQPDLAVIDITLCQGDGLDLVKRLVAKQETLHILVWSMHSEDLYAERALRAGAHGFITKEHATEEIIEAIQQVMSGKIFLGSAMTDKLLGRLSRGGDKSLAHSPVELLSDRELEVMRLIGNGVRTAEIASQLHLSVKTVETYRDRIRHKLDLTNGNDLVCYAAQWILEN